MLCPVCLGYGLDSAVEVTVTGTGYCKVHGVEAFAQERVTRQPSSGRPSRQFSVPPKGRPEE